MEDSRAMTKPDRRFFSVGNDNAEKQVRSSRRGRFATRTDSPFTRTRSAAKLGSFEETPGITGCLDAIIASGNGLLLGVTRDGGAISLTIMIGEERHRAYATGQEELNQAVEDIITYLAL
jgi:hypothetical protein